MLPPRRGRTSFWFCPNNVSTWTLWCRVDEDVRRLELPLLEAGMSLLVARVEPRTLPALRMLGANLEEVENAALAPCGGGNRAPIIAVMSDFTCAAVSLVLARFDDVVPLAVHQARHSQCRRSACSRIAAARAVGEG